MKKKVTDTTVDVTVAKYDPSIFNNQIAWAEDNFGVIDIPECQYDEDQGYYQVATEPAGKFSNSKTSIEEMPLEYLYTNATDGYSYIVFADYTYGKDSTVPFWDKIYVNDVLYGDRTYGIFARSSSPGFRLKSSVSQTLFTSADVGSTISVKISYGEEVTVSI